MSVANSVPSRSLTRPYHDARVGGLFSPFQCPAEWVALHKHTYKTSSYNLFPFERVMFKSLIIE